MNQCLTEELIEEFVDPMGMAEVGNITFQGHHACIGIFTHGQLAVPNPTFPDTGIVLSTGSPASLAYQNSDKSSVLRYTAGDPDLEHLVGTWTKDACVLEFDVQCPPGKDGPAEIEFQYVFGSEEYNEWAGSQYNDVFGFFLNGMNIALLPDGVTPVSINNVNEQTNSMYFIENDPSDNGGLASVPYPKFEADGFTITLSASGPVVEDTPNRFKFAIADVGDHKLDSWVLIKGSSFKCKKVLDDDKPPTGVSGDPHFSTWSGHKFDYHGACDLVLLQNPSFNDRQGMDVHIRTKHIRDMSYVVAAAVRIGDDILEVQSDQYFVNGDKNAPLPATLGGFKVTHKQVNDHQQTFMIRIRQQTMVIKTWKQFVSVKVEHATVEDFGASVGLMGSFGTGHMLSRSGSFLGDANEFGQEWQVRSDEAMLFQTFQWPQHPQECRMPPTRTTRRRLGDSGISEMQAKVACASVPSNDQDSCIADVLTTGDVSVAEAYA